MTQSNIDSIEHSRADSPWNSDEIQILSPLASGIRHSYPEVRILHVDDDADFVEISALHLERIDDEFSITIETDVDSALKRVEIEMFDCVVSDYEMPRTDGIEFLHTVREINQEIPFILFTGKGSEEIASQAIRSGVTDYMQKKIGTNQYEVLGNRIRNAVDQYRTSQELWRTLSWYKRLVDQNLVGIYIVQNGKFAYVNERFADIFGFSQSDFIGKSGDLFSDQESPALALLSDTDLSQNDEFQTSVTGKRADGATISIDVHGGAVEFNESSALMGILIENHE